MITRGLLLLLTFEKSQQCGGPWRGWWTPIERSGSSPRPSVHREEPAIPAGALLLVAGVTLVGAATRDLILLSGPDPVVVAARLEGGQVVCGEYESDDGVLRIQTVDDLGVKVTRTVSLDSVEAIATPPVCPG
jgi:hypothetical protein